MRQDHLDVTLRRRAEAPRDAGYDVDVVCLPQSVGARPEDLPGTTDHRLPMKPRRGSTLNYLAD